jgi:hypothetical protein
MITVNHVFIVKAGRSKLSHYTDQEGGEKMETSLVRLIRSHVTTALYILAVLACLMHIALDKVTSGWVAMWLTFLLLVGLLVWLVVRIYFDRLIGLLAALATFVLSISLYSTADHFDFGVIILGVIAVAGVYLFTRPKPLNVIGTI